jgi:hypothetical protein
MCTQENKRVSMPEDSFATCALISVFSKVKYVSESLGVTFLRRYVRIIHRNLSGTHFDILYVMQTVYFDCTPKIILSLGV